MAEGLKRRTIRSAGIGASVRVVAPIEDESFVVAESAVMANLRPPMPVDAGDLVTLTTDGRVQRSRPDGDGGWESVDERRLPNLDVRQHDCPDCRHYVARP